MASNRGKRTPHSGGDYKDTPNDCRRKVTMKNVPDDISEDTIMQYAKKFGTVEGSIGRKVAVNPGEATTIFITFDSFNSANRFMEHRDHRINGLPYQVMRGNMKGTKGSGEQISRVSVSYVNPKDQKWTDEQKEKYFSRFGAIYSITYKNDNKDFFVDYVYYDSADKALLSQPTTIHAVANSAKVIVEKDAAPYWILGTGLPNEFSYADLLELLGSRESIIRVVDVLFDSSMGYCWIQANKAVMLKEPVAHIQANMWTIKAIQKKTQIVFKPIRPTIFRSQLCGYYQSDSCMIQQCRYEHIACPLYNTCSDTKCWFGHSQQRALCPRARDEEGEEKLFCTKIIGLPDDTEHYKLSKALGNQLRNNRLQLLPRTDDRGVIAYVHWHLSSSLKEIRKSLDRWHNSRYDLKYPIQCQLEIDYSNPFEDDRTIVDDDYDDVHVSETDRDEADGLSDRRGADTELDADGCPSDWNRDYHWTGENLSGNHKGQAVVFRAVRRKDRHECVVKVYTSTVNDQHRFRARREIIALQRLAGVSGVAQLFYTNVSLEKDDENTILWAILDRVEGVTLREKVQDRLDLSTSVEITQKLHTVVSAFHALEIVHRDIKPANIMIGHNNTLTVIDFGMAFVRTYERFEQPVDDQSTFVEQELANQFFQPPQLEKQLSPENDENKENMVEIRRSQTTDASATCAILFWLVTGKKPVKVLWKGTVVHKVKEHNDLIENTIRDATGDRKLRKLLRTQLTTLFDKGFADFDGQWTDELLGAQLKFLADLVNQDEEDSSEEEEQNTTVDNNWPALVPSTHSSRASSVVSGTSSRNSYRPQTATTLHSCNKLKDTDMPTSTAVVPKNSATTAMNDEALSTPSAPKDEDAFTVVRRRK